MRIVEAVKLKNFSKHSRFSYIGDNISPSQKFLKKGLIFQSGNENLIVKLEKKLKI